MLLSEKEEDGREGEEEDALCEKRSWIIMQLILAILEQVMSVDYPFPRPWWPMVGQRKRSSKVNTASLSTMEETIHMY